MITISNQLAYNYRMINREAKIAWYLHFFRFLLKRMKNKIEVNLDSFYITLLGAIEASDKFSREDALKELNNIKLIQKSFLRLEAIIGESNFLVDLGLKEKWDNCLDTLYKLEGEMRIKAFSASQKTETDANFIHILSEKSILNTQNVLARYAV